MSTPADTSRWFACEVKSLLWYWLPVAAYAGLIFSLSALSHPEEYTPSVLGELGDKVLHGIEYGGLAALCYRAFRYAAGRWAASYAVALAIAAAVGYAATDELHQAFVPLREPDGWDFVADAAGACVGAWGWQWLAERSPFKTLWYLVSPRA